MSLDLFGRQLDPQYAQGELGGPSIAVGRTCPACGRALVDTTSGFKSCPLGHGRLEIPDTHAQLSMGAVPVPAWVPSQPPGRKRRGT